MTARPSPLERIELVIASRTEELARVAACLDEVAARRRLPAEPVGDMHVALDEILANVLNHAYDDATGHEIQVVLAVYPHALEVTVEDDGRPFDPLQVPPPDRSLPLGERRIGGLGIHFVRGLMSGVAYQRVGERNRLVLTRAFDGIARAR